jgi:hypothetical protein
VKLRIKYEESKHQMTKKKLINICLNLTLLVGFLLTFFLDLTGIELHQYIGIAVAGFVMLHLVTHWKWVLNVTARIFKPTPGRVRLYYVLDFLLFISIIIISVTGIFISTWLKTFIPNYVLLLSVHILASITGLLFLLLKLGLHWKYFANLMGSLRDSVNRKPELTFPSLTGNRVTDYGRRDALKTIGLVSGVGLLAFFKAASAFTIPKPTALPSLESDTKEPEQPSGSLTAQQPIAPSDSVESVEPIEPIEQGQGQGKRGRRHGQNASQEQLPQQSLEPHQELSPEAVFPEQPAAEQPPIDPSQENCIVRCTQGCAFPGACRHYIDQNQNQFCDLGECLVV